MFGYIRPKKAELRVKEYEAYRGVYCSVCKVLGQRYGVLSRLALSYDSTFYAMLLLSQSGKPCGFRRGRCVVNPLKACVFCTDGEALLQQAAALCVLLTVQKLQDDRQDRAWKSRVRAVPLLPLTRRAARRAAADFPWMAAAAEAYGKQQAAAEKMPAADLDACAQPTAEMLARVLQQTAPDESSRLVLREVGYYLGRWIYLMDAADDLEQDLRTGDFNWFVGHFHLQADSPPQALQAAREEANACLNLSMARLCAAFDLLETQTFTPILRNIVEQGLPEMQKQLLFKKEIK